MRRCVRTEADTELVLVRHAVGRCNEAGVIGGRQGCTGLSEQGRLDSEELAGRLAAMAAERPFDVLLSSPRLRVLECARILGSRLGMPVAVVHRLAGQEFGAADGRPWQRVTQRFGGPPMHDPDRPIATGAEPWNVYADRVLGALVEVLAEHAGHRICLVGHGRTAALAGALLSGAPDPRAVAPGPAIDHGELTVWRLDAAGWCRARLDAEV
jgi:probable phosphoglycerate mutase